MSGEKSCFRTCPLCEAMCGLEIRDGKVSPDPDDVLSQGYICPKGPAIMDIQNDPERLTRPLQRTKSGWREIGWNAAFDLVAERLQAIRAEHGIDSVAIYQGNPTVHNLGAMVFGQIFVRNLRTKNRYSATSVDQLPQHLAALELFGHMGLLHVPDIDHTNFMLILGANPAVSNGSLMSAPGAARRLRAIRKRGGRVVVVDPRRTETAAIADAHHAIRPGTDAWLLLALLHVIFDEGLERDNHVTPQVDGMDTLRDLAVRFSPERAAPVTGIDAADIRRLARDFTAAPSAVLYGRVGACTQVFGGLVTWLISVVNIVTGNLDSPGGAMFATPAIDVLKHYPRGNFNRYQSRVRKLPSFTGELPCVVLAEEILTPGEGQIRALITHAGNPVLSLPNGRRLENALGKLEFMVSIDFYKNATTKHADVILPPTPPLEHDHYDLAFLLLAVRNLVRYSPAVYEKPAGAKHDWEIFLELHARMHGWRAKLLRTVFRNRGPGPILDYGLRTGPYKLTLAKVKEHPHGLDLGPLQPRLPTDRRIPIAPALFVDDLKRLEASERATAPGDALLLIGRRHLRANNSWMHYRPLAGGTNRCTLMIHPDDATARGLDDGDTAQVKSRAGQIDVAIEITADMRPGVVSLPHGWRETSINDVTDHEWIDSLTGNAALSGVPVRVSPT